MRHKTSKVFEKIMQRYGLSREEIVTEFENRTKLLYEMFKRRIFSFQEVFDIINEYYKTPQAVLTKFGISQVQ